MSLTAYVFTWFGLILTGLSLLVWACVAACGRESTKQLHATYEVKIWNETAGKFVSMGGWDYIFTNRSHAEMSLRDLQKASASRYTVEAD